VSEEIEELKGKGFLSIIHRISLRIAGREGRDHLGGWKAMEYFASFQAFLPF